MWITQIFEVFRNILNLKNLFALCLFFITMWFVLSSFYVKYYEKTYNMMQIIDKNVTLINAHFVFHSTFYYKKSKLYSPNTVVILMNGPKNLETIKLECHSKNVTSNMMSGALLRVAEPGPHCKWISYLINCTTVSNPHYFGISLQNSSAIFEIPFEIPVIKKYPVVMCYPPMVYESRWQQIIYAIEVYRHFGTDLQIQYINSALAEIVDLLEIYKTKGWIDIERFAYIDLNPTMLSSIGYNPMLELDSRNQPIAYTNCIMKYREAAEFVIAADVDDILIPTQSHFYPEFFQWHVLFPNAPAFFYHRFVGEIKAAKSFHNFSIFDTLRSFKLSNSTVVGKSVYQTKNAEVAWIHWPFFKNESTAEIPHQLGKMFHVQLINHSITTNSIIPLKQIKKISDEFSLTFKNFSLSFLAASEYANAIKEYYWGSSTWNPETRPCLTPLQAPMPKIVKDFKCKVAKRNFLTNFLNESVIFHVPFSDYYWNNFKNGCQIFE